MYKRVNRDGEKPLPMYILQGIKCMAFSMEEASIQWMENVILLYRCQSGDPNYPTGHALLLDASRRLNAETSPQETTFVMLLFPGCPLTFFLDATGTATHRLPALDQTFTKLQSPFTESSPCVGVDEAFKRTESANCYPVEHV